MKEGYEKNVFHSKVGVVNGDKITDDTAIYIGSHNLSPSAWGNLQKENSQISIANYEAGVFFRPMKGSAKIK